MKVSSVSPERWLTITPQPLLWAILQLEGRNAQTLNGCTQKIIHKTGPSPKHSRLQGLSDRADLVHFEQQAVAGFLGHTLGDAFGVGDREVVAYHLNAGAGCKIGPRLPVILVKGILDGHHCAAEEWTLTKISVKSFRTNWPHARISPFSHLGAEQPTY